MLTIVVLIIGGAILLDIGVRFTGVFCIGLGALCFIMFPLLCDFINKK
jgi:hypothetical protein